MAKNALMYPVLKHNCFCKCLIDNDMRGNVIGRKYPWGGGGGGGDFYNLISVHALGIFWHRKEQGVMFIKYYVSSSI